MVHDEGHRLVNSTSIGLRKMSGPMRQDQRWLAEVTFLAFDTETTGLFPIMHRLIEVGALRFRLGNWNLAAF
jgi:DNA polymerase III epsilon subunit-like protein